MNVSVCGGLRLHSHPFFVVLGRVQLHGVPGQKVWQHTHPPTAHVPDLVLFFCKQLEKDVGETFEVECFHFLIM